MRIVRLLARPGALLAAATVVTVVAVEWSARGVVLGLLGAIVGWLGGLLALQVGMLGGALALGLRVHQVVVGVGRRVRDWTTPSRALVLRSVPLFLSVSVGPGKAPVRARMWLASLCSAAVGVLAAVALTVTASGGFRLGLAIGCAVTVLHAMIPRNTAGSTSTGWLLFVMPRLTGKRAEQLRAAPLVSRTVDAAQAGHLALADALATELTERHPGLRTATAARILVHQVHGRYAHAMVLAMGMIEDPEQTPEEAAVFFAALAGLACATVEAGQLEPDIGLPTAEQAIENAKTLGYPAHKLTGTRALHHLLTGDSGRAITLARQAADAGDDLLGRADDLATLTAAHMAAGDNRSARAALAEAESLVPWWPRLDPLRTRLTIA